MCPKIRPAWPVLLHDESAGRAAIVQHALAADERLHLQSWTEHPAKGAIVVTGWQRSGASPEEIASVRRLRAQGAQILCYAPAIGESPLGSRCEVLLAGARHLLDCDASDFLDQLRAAVGALAQEEADRLAESNSLHASMRDARVAAESEAMQGVFRAVERLSAFSDLPVLITGETGTGKELIANAIHRKDPRRAGGPFIPVNCGALNTELSGSELFGHRRGAYTGAMHDRAGLFRAAHGGVIFLDEVGELPAMLQAKVLRVLQTGRLLGVGEDQEIAVDVRVIAATNRDLPGMVAGGSFREDLFHRLNVTAIHIPPLRERPADIAPLVTYFLEQYRHLGGADTIAASPDFLRALESARLPGNARQVENLVRQAMVLREHPGSITLRDLPPELLREVAGQESCARMPIRSEQGLAQDLTAVLESNGWNLNRSLERVEQMLVQTALKHANGNQAQAARRLGITPRSIYNKLHRRV